jgi:hypothetical protein
MNSKEKKRRKKEEEGEEETKQVGIEKEKLAPAGNRTPVSREIVRLDKRLCLPLHHGSWLSSVFGTCEVKVMISGKRELLFAVVGY